MNFNYKTKLILTYFAVILTALSLLIYIFEHSKQTDINNISNQKFEEVFKIKNHFFLSYFDVYTKTIKALHENDVVREYAKTKKNKKEISELFLTIKKSLPDLFQLRYIDANGMEKIKVNGTAISLYGNRALSFLEPQEKLQNKFSRDYFQQFLKLSPHQVAFSHINLNKEHGKVEIPKRPTIRIAIPVYLKDNTQILGVIVMNLNVKILLKKTAKSPLYKMFIVDSKGVFINHYDNDKSLYGNTTWTVKDEFPYNHTNIMKNGTFSEENIYSRKIQKFNNNQNLKLILVPKFQDISSKVRDSQDLYILMIILIAIIIIPILISKNYQKYYREKIDTLVDTYDIHVLSLSIDINKKITHVSEAFCKISGYSKKELIGNDFFMVLDKQSSSNGYVELIPVFQNHQCWQGELTNKRKDESQYIVKGVIEPKYDDDHVIGFDIVFHDITDHKKIEKLSNQVNILLSNIDEGVLSFDLNRKVKTGCSNECMKMLKQDKLIDKDISDLLFKHNPRNNALFKEGIEYIKNSTDKEQRELFLSLLPTETKVASKELTLRYKFLEDDTIMLSIDNITFVKRLEQEIHAKEQLLQMVLAIIKNKTEFLELKSDYEKFLNNLEIDSLELEGFIKSLHTFKGLFLQKGLLNTSEAIHELENEIKDLIYEKANTLDINATLKNGTQDLLSVFSMDMSMINQVFGDGFLEEVDKQFKYNQINHIKNKLSFLLEQNVVVDNIILSNILHEILKLDYTPLYNLMISYPDIIEQLATKLDKKVNRVEIIGDRNILVPNDFRALIKNFIHIYRNSVDHGIESIEERITKGKKEFGTIKTSFIKKNNNIIIEISDDGRGIDIEKVKNKVQSNKLLSVQNIDSLSEQELLQIIFNEHFTTKDETTLISGQGIGLSIIKEEIDRLGGTISLENEYEQGIKFTFNIPVSLIDNSSNIHDIIKFHLLEYLENTLQLEVTNLFIANVYVPYPEIDYITGIDIHDGVNMFCGLVLEEKLLEYIKGIMLPSGCTEEEIEIMTKEIVGEMINTYIGLSLYQLGEYVGSDVRIGTPYNLEIEQFLTKMKHSKSYNVIQIHTNHGSLVVPFIEHKEK